jgi:hypothetical protein
MIIFDWSQYRGLTGEYCTGQDDVSMTLEQTGSWDIPMTKLINELTHKGALFVDVGCHIGYFSRVATNNGCEVIAYDGDAENLELFTINNPNASANLFWFDENIGWIEPMRIDLLKIDIEGAERFAIEYFSLCKIKNIIIEVSPVFNDSYPELINRLSDTYNVYNLDGTKFNFDFNFAQTDLWLTLH